MATTKRPRPIAGNTRDGRLYTTRVPNRFEGERRTVGGRFETRLFSGKREQCRAEWEAWRDEALSAANIHVEPPRKAQGKTETTETNTEVADMPKKAEKKEERRMYVLTFRGQRSARDVALFEGEDAALRMAEALEVALDATSTEGGYEINELPIWG